MKDAPSKPAPFAAWMSPEDRRLLRWIGHGLLLAFFVWLAWRVREIVPLFLLGLFVAYLFDPLLDRLQKRGWSRLRSVWFVFAVFFLLFLVLAFIVVPAAIAQVHNAVANVPIYQEKVMDLIATGEDFLDRYQIPAQVQDMVRQMKQKVQHVVPKVAAYLAHWLTGAIASLFLLLILPIICFYFMNEFDIMRLRALSMVPQEYRDTVVMMSREVNDMLARYVRGQALVSVSFSTVMFVVLSIFSLIFQMKYTLILALLAGVTCLIPYLGTATLAITTGIVAYVTANHNPWICVVGVVLSLIIVNQVFDNLVAPRLVGGKVGLHPLIVLFALMAGGKVYGILGMLIAVPVAGSIKVLVLHLFPELQTPLRDLEMLDQTYQTREISTTNDTRKAMPQTTDSTTSNPVEQSNDD